MMSNLEKGLSESVYWKKNYGIDHVLVDTDFILERLDHPITKYLKNMTIGHHVLAPILNLNSGLYVDYRKDPPWACTVMVPMNEKKIDKEYKVVSQNCHENGRKQLKKGLKTIRIGIFRPIMT